MGKFSLKKTARAVASLCLCFEFLCSASCEKAPSAYTLEPIFSQGSVFTQILWREKGSEPTGIKELLKENELTFSHTNEFSELYKLNLSGGGEVSEKLNELLNIAFDITEKTKGAFDVSYGNLFDLWEQTETAPPSNENIAASLASSGKDKLTVNGNSYSLNGTRLNLGGIAKGYSVGEILSFYAKDKSVSGALISCTSSVGVLGTKEENKPFKIGIRNPSKSADEHIASLELSNVLISTSGDYEKTYQSADGKSYHHILNLNTGFPAENGLRSVTVVAQFTDSEDLKYLGALTDALSTAVFVMGMEDESLSLLKELSLDAVFVTDNRVYITEGLKNKAQITDTSYSLEVIK